MDERTKERELNKASMLADITGLDPLEVLLKQIYEFQQDPDCRESDRQKLLKNFELRMEQNEQESYFIRHGMKWEGLKKTALSANLLDTATASVAENPPGLTQGHVPSISSADTNKVQHYTTGEYSLGESFNIFVLKHLRYFPGTFHDHDFIEIAWMLKGSCTQKILVDGNIKEVEMTAGCALIIPPGLAHKVEIYEENSAMINLMVRMETFHKAFLMNFPEDNLIFRFFSEILSHGQSRNYILLQTDGDSSLQELIWKMYLEEEKREAFSDRACDLYLQLWFLALLRHQTRLEGRFEQTKSSSNGVVLSILIYLETHFETASLSGVEAVYGYTPAYLNRMFRNYTGTTIQKYISDLKLEKARNLVEKSQMSIAEIGEVCGYQDTAFFIRQFKKKYEITPYQMRLKKNS